MYNMTIKNPNIFKEKSRQTNPNRLTTHIYSKYTFSLLASLLSMIQP